MTSPRLHLIHSAEPLQPSDQTGYANPLRVIECRGHRRIGTQADVTKAECPVLWQRFVQYVFGHGPGARDATAVAFGCTFQTACNWHEGFVAPMGHAVLHASQAFPDEYDAIFRPDRQRRAA